MRHKLESRLLEEISITSDMQMKLYEALIIQAAFSYGGLTREEFIFSLIQFFGRINFLVIVELKFLASCWFLSRHCPYLSDVAWSSVGSPLQYSCLDNPGARGAW